MRNRLPSIPCGLLRRIARDRAGNTLALVAAAIAPLMAMVGGGIDMGRSYLSQSRLQQACDAGVLAARKRLGSEAVVSGDVPADTAEVGQRFFNINFRRGSYGTEDRQFVMTLEEDYAISGVATVVVPTTIMRIFGFQEVPVRVECEAQINFSNTDIMMVLDVTGSMNEINPGDGASKLAALKSTVKSFYAQLASSAKAGARIRYGFVPYSTNVNVGHLLEDDWVVDEWWYQSRELASTLQVALTSTRYTGATKISGSITTTDYTTYAASFDENKGYYCPSRPGSTVSTSTETTDKKSELVILPLPGVRTTETIVRTRDGSSYSVGLDDTTCVVRQTTYTDYVDTYQKISEPKLGTETRWKYKQLKIDVSDWRDTSNGCMEERDTYEIGDYDNVNLAKALDLDIDRIPEPGNAKTQWRPMYPDIIYARAIQWNGGGSFTNATVITDKEFYAPADAGLAPCPTEARKLSEMTSEELDTYIDSLTAAGSTYHDIGMIWGGRLISPTGLFAEENADLSSSTPTSRNLIFLTDGLTATLDLSYGTYGLEPLDKRRWSLDSSLTLTQTVEKRFAFACEEVKKKNVQVWVIGFGTSLNPIMKDCAGEGHYFEAADAAELNATFATIAKNLSDLRIQR